MASTSESGHAKNLANANLLNTYILQLGATYNPSNPNLLLANLQSIYTTCNTHQNAVNTSVAPYTFAVDEREAIFAPVNKKVTVIRKVYKSTEGVTPAQMEDFMTIARKIKGTRKTAAASTTDATEAQTQHSTSQLSYDQRTNNYGLLISQLQNTPNYNPNETEFKIATLQAERNAMLQATQNVANTFVPLNSARANRNNSFYLSENNLVDTFNKAKDYLSTILDSKSVQYKAIAKIKFKKA